MMRPTWAAVGGGLRRLGPASPKVEETTCWVCRLCRRSRASAIWRASSVTCQRHTILYETMKLVWSNRFSIILHLPYKSLNNTVDLKIHRLSFIIKEKFTITKQTFFFH